MADHRRWVLLVPSNQGGHCERKQSIGSRDDFALGDIPCCSYLLVNDARDSNAIVSSRWRLACDIKRKVAKSMFAAQGKAWLACVPTDSSRGNTYLHGDETPDIQASSSELSYQRFHVLTVFGGQIL